MHRSLRDLTATSVHAELESRVPPGSGGLGVRLSTMRNQRFFDIKLFDQALPGWKIEVEHYLASLRPPLLWLALL
jgi:hypothetical protein